MKSALGASKKKKKKEKRSAPNPLPGRRLTTDHRSFIFPPCASRFYPPRIQSLCGFRSRRGQPWPTRSSTFPEEPSSIIATRVSTRVLLRVASGTRVASHDTPPIHPPSVDLVSFFSREGIGLRIPGFRLDSFGSREEGAALGGCDWGSLLDDRGCWNGSEKVEK